MIKDIMRNLRLSPNVQFAFWNNHSHFTLGWDSFWEEIHSFARADPFVGMAFVTGDCAAPLKFAFTFFNSMLPNQIVASATAHWSATTHPSAISIASSSARAMNIGHQIAFTKCWRPLIIEESIFQWFLVESCRRMFGENFTWWSIWIAITMFTSATHPIWWDECFAIAHIRLIHENRIAKHMFEHFSNDTKLGSTFPTSFQLTTARHTMALATNLHIIGHSLKNIEQNRF